MRTNIQWSQNYIRDSSCTDINRVLLVGDACHNLINPAYLLVAKTFPFPVVLASLLIYGQLCTFLLCCFLCGENTLIFSALGSFTTALIFVSLLSHLHGILWLQIAAVVAVGYADISPEVYWKKVLPNTPIPNFILEKLHPGKSSSSLLCFFHSSFEFTISNIKPSLNTSWIGLFDSGFEFSDIICRVHLCS